MNNDFKILVDHILEAMWKAEPVGATVMGIHRYDHLLSQCNASSRAQRLKEIQRQLEQLQRFPAKTLDDAELLDRRILMDHLETTAYITERLKPYNRLASMYLDEASFGVYMLQMRAFAPLPDRARSVLGRLRVLPDYLADATANLKEGEDIPRAWTETAIEEAESGIHFFQNEVPLFAEKVPALKADIVQASAQAVEAFKRFLRFLKKELLLRSDGDFAAGKEVFDFLLAKEHGLPYHTEDLLRIGNEILEASREALNAIAHQMDANVRDWTEALKIVKQEYPADDQVVATYAEQMRAARDFVVRHDLVTIPAGEALDVVETPIFQRPTIPYAAYISPAPFEREQTGVFWVTPIDMTRSPEEQEAQRQDHNIHGIPVTALHEGYPGHHLQLVHANKVASDVRRQFGTPVFWEGWALYCEEMMYEEGFYTDPRSRLCQLKDQLWRACRVLIDVKLHTGQMTFDEAVDMLVDVPKLERPNAIAEVRRYVQTPTQPMSYVIGKLEIMKLRRDYQAALGERFNLKVFHDKLLSYGSIPVGLLRERLLTC